MTNIERAKKKARDDYRQKKASLERQLVELDQQQEALERAFTLIEQESEGGNLQPRSIVRKAVDHCSPKGFTRTDVEAAIKEKLNAAVPSRMVIVGELQEMVTEGRLAIVVQGKGRRATVYRGIG